MKKMLLPLLCCLFLGACGTYLTPTLSQNPEKMSIDTLCYRAATHPENEALADEIRARNLDCDKVMEDERLYTGGR